MTVAFVLGIVCVCATSARYAGAAEQDNAVGVESTGSNAVPAAKPLTEQEKIEKLIAALGALKGATFLRNGSEHTAKDAADHVRSKWSAQKKEIRTAQEFIEKAASKSSMSGQPYVIRLSDGKEVKAGEWLRERLTEIEKPK